MNPNNPDYEEQEAPKMQLTKKQTLLARESVEDFLSRGGKIDVLPYSPENNCKKEKESITDKLMRDAENEVGCYRPYWG